MMHVGMATGFANHLKVDDARFMREEFVQCMLAEELGFDSVWVTEHHFCDYSMSPDPLMTLSWLAGRAQRIRLGTQVIVAPWHDPVRLAEQIVMLDHLSGGRAIIGFGRGLARDEYEGLRVDQSKARELFDEIVALVMTALETGFIEGGEHFKQPRRALRPRPLRSLKGRAFAGGGTPASMVAAAKLGLGRLFLNQPMTTSRQRPPFGGGSASAQAQTVPVDPTAGSINDDWLEAWSNARPGETPPSPFVSNLVFVDDSPERAHELARTYAANTFRAAINHYELTSDHHGTVKGYEAYQALKMKPDDVEKAVEGVVQSSIFGTPQQVLEKHEAVKKLRKPQGFFPHLWTGGMSHGEAMRNTRFFAAHCLPELKSWTAEPSTIGEPLRSAA
jgi:alkanesulfonate monooxygenase SsuD/methylene tetrahydromethanopterin reductase-like flavin-dependent oxidoreductase (luciferase family)